MAEAEFEILAAKVLAGEASADERRRLEELLAQDSSHRAEFAELELARVYVRTIGPLARALEAQPEPIPEHRLRELKAVVIKEFGREAKPQPRGETMVELVLRWSHGNRVAVSVAALLALAIGLSLVFRWPHRISEPRSQSSAPAYLLSAQGRLEIRREGRSLSFAPILTLRPGDELRLAAGTSIGLLTEHGAFQVTGPKNFALASLNTNDPAFNLHPTGVEMKALTNGVALKTRAALFQPMKQLLALSLFVTKRDVGNIPVYSPAGSTRSLTPVIFWRSDPGKRYDLSISDELNPNAEPLQLNGVTPPVEFTKVIAWQGHTLAKNGLYLIRITEQGNPLSATESTFRTLSDAFGPSTDVATPLEKIDRARQSLLTLNPSLGDALAELLTLPSEFAEAELVLRLKLVAFGQLGLKEEYDATSAKLASK